MTPNQQNFIHIHLGQLLNLNWHMLAGRWQEVQITDFPLFSRTNPPSHLGGCQEYVMNHSQCTLSQTPAPWT